MRNVIQCVVPENIHIPPRRATKIQRQGGDPEGGNFRGGGVGHSSLSSPGAPSTIDEQDISYFFLISVSKQKYFFIDDLLFAVG